MMAVRDLLQNKPANPGEKSIGLYTPLRMISKDSLYNGACWNLDDVKKYGP
jgi:ribose transport system substrate-binding protein